MIIDKDQMFWILGGGALSALFFLSLLIGFPFPMQLAPFPIFYVGLRFGLRPGALTGLFALGVMALFPPVAFSLFFALIFLAPTVVLLFLALSLKEDKMPLFSFNYIMGTLVLYQGSVSALLSLLLFSEGDFLEALVGSVSQLPELSVFPILQDKAVVEAVLKVVPGSMGLSGGVILFFNFFLSALLLKKQSLGLRSLAKIGDLSFPWWPWVALALCGVLAYLASGSLFGVLVLNLLLVLGLVFLLQGLSIVHYICDAKGWGQLALWFFYGLMLIFGELVVIIATLGVFEPWIQLRQRIKKN